MWIALLLTRYWQCALAHIAIAKKAQVRNHSLTLCCAKPHLARLRMP